MSTVNSTNNDQSRKEFEFLSPSELNEGGYSGDSKNLNAFPSNSPGNTPGNINRSKNAHLHPLAPNSPQLKVPAFQFPISSTRSITPSSYNHWEFTPHPLRIASLENSYTPRYFDSVFPNFDTSSDSADHTHTAGSTNNNNSITNNSVSGNNTSIFNGNINSLANLLGVSSHFVSPSTYSPYQGQPKFSVANTSNLKTLSHTHSSSDPNLLSTKLDPSFSSTTSETQPKLPAATSISNFFGDCPKDASNQKIDNLMDTLTAVLNNNTYDGATACPQDLDVASKCPKTYSSLFKNVENNEQVFKLTPLLKSKVYKDSIDIGQTSLITPSPIFRTLHFEASKYTDSSIGTKLSDSTGFDEVDYKDDNYSYIPYRFQTPLGPFGTYQQQRPVIRPTELEEIQVKLSSHKRTATLAQRLSNAKDMSFTPAVFSSPFKYQESFPSDSPVSESLKYEAMTQHSSDSNQSGLPNTMMKNFDEPAKKKQKTDNFELLNTFGKKSKKLNTKEFNVTLKFNNRFEFINYIASTCKGSTGGVISLSSECSLADIQDATEYLKTSVEPTTQASKEIKKTMRLTLKKSSVPTQCNKIKYLKSTPLQSREDENNKLRTSSADEDKGKENNDIKVVRKIPITSNDKRTKGEEISKDGKRERKKDLEKGKSKELEIIKNKELENKKEKDKNKVKKLLEGKEKDTKKEKENNKEGKHVTSTESDPLISLKDDKSIIKKAPLDVVLSIIDVDRRFRMLSAARKKRIPPKTTKLFISLFKLRNINIKLRIISMFYALDKNETEFSDQEMESDPAIFVRELVFGDTSDIEKDFLVLKCKTYAGTESIDELYKNSIMKCFKGIARLDVYFKLSDQSSKKESKKNRKGKSEDGKPKVGRPLNSFMLYRYAMVKAFMLLGLVNALTPFIEKNCDYKKLSLGKSKKEIEFEYLAQLEQRMKLDLLTSNPKSRSNEFKELQECVLNNGTYNEFPHHNLIKLTSILWQTEYEITKEQFTQLAELEKAVHRLCHPDYEYHPVRKE